MTKEELIGKLQMVYVGDKNALNELIGYYDGLKQGIEELQQENKQLKDNWNKLKKHLINDINNRNGNKVAEYEDGGKVSETISPIYTLMEDKSKTMKEVLDKIQELEQGSD
ncbi:MAG: hypothetical protein MR691_15040 [Clostridium sp.]|nr:hypothetical protein [Clostridium sp.]